MEHSFFEGFRAQKGTVTARRRKKNDAAAGDHDDGRAGGGWVNTALDLIRRQ